MRFSTPGLRLLTGVLALLALPLFGGETNSLFAGSLSITPVGSTVPPNGDVNPYGVAVVPVALGSLIKNEILVSNFNAVSNLQGTGTTIVQMSQSGELSVFATITPASLPGPCPGGVGLTTALVALKSGFVVVGSLPTTDGSAATAQAGCLIVLNSAGVPVLTLSGGGINGPWDMTALDLGSSAILFVTNVLDGTVAANGSVVKNGTVLRIVLSTPVGGTPRELGSTVIGSGFSQRTDPAALVIGPTGLGITSTGLLYVADTLENRIAVIPQAVSRSSSAGVGTTVSQNGALNQPLGLVISPNGDILTVNAGNGDIVQTTPAGVQAAAVPIDVSGQGAGTLFGLAVAPEADGIYYVDDGNNTLNLLQQSEIF
jgi:hypothetical protein